MSLSYDLISEFVKITNDKKDDKKEGTVYATIVSGTGGKYVRIDGSDLLTPMDTTTDIEDGERVTLMIKDHKAIVTGNVTTPSASTSKVDKVTESVNSVSDRVGTFELVVADKVSTNELEAYKATIEVLIANKATIEDLTATNAKIENLEVKNAKIENLVAEKATIEDLEAVNATIENLKVKDAEIENAVVENLKATTADIKILNADFAQIKTLVNGNLTSDNILSFNLTSGKVTVDDAFIKDAMIDTVNAAKINAGEINTNLVSIGSEDGGMLITGSTQQFTDKNGNVRIQIGKDASGDFTFVLYGEDGTGQLINQNGITASAIGDGLIVNNMVSDNAAISGGKLDISSVIFEINNDTSTTIKSSKIYLNEQAQSLEVAFNSLKTKVDTIQEVTIQGDLTAIVEQVQSNTSKIEANRDSISTLISEDTIIKKQVINLQGTLNETETTLNSKYTSLSQNLNGFKTTVADTYATKKSVTDVVDNISANYSTTSVMNSAIEQKAQEISASVSSTYATKNQVNTLDNNLKTNYSTTKQMESAISIAKEEINLGVSELYETKSEVTNKINGLSISSVNRVLGSEFSKSKTFTSADNECWAPYKISGDIRNKKVVIAFDYVATNIVKQTGYGIKFQTTYKVSDDTTAWYPSVDFNLADGNSSGTIISSPVKFGDIKAGNNPEFRFRFDKVSGTLEISKARVFIGTKDLGWSPAPEDIDNNIELAKTEAISSANDTLTSTISNYYTKSQTDSQINVAKEAINLGVSTTYETKTNVQTKVTSTLNSAKSYADTKKKEAISTAATDATSKANTAKSEAIKSANNTLTSTISNYYTKTQTDSQINVAKEAINLGVSKTYETKANVESKIKGISVGGTNLAFDTNKGKTGWGWGIQTNGGYTITEYWADGINGVKMTKDANNASGWNYVSYNSFKRDKITPATTYVVSFEIKSNQTFNIDSIILKEANATNNLIKSITAVQNKVTANSTAWSKIIFRLVTLDTLPSSTSQVIYITGIPGTANATHYFRNLKLEAGNTPTAWSPAPEDVKNDINTAKNDAIKSANNTLTSTIANYYTKSQTDSQINVAKDAINLGVSQTYETKANVTSKVDSTLKSAKSYTDTKKSEAISTAASDATSKANTAKQEAIKSANNTLTSTIANYYTKSQTDSQINVAKDAINLGVSKTYETKENVTTKINNIQVGGRNLIKNSNKRLNSKTPTSVQLGGVVDYQKLKGKTVTLSMDINVSGMTNVSGESNRVGFEMSITHTDGTVSYIGIWHEVSDGDYNGRKTKTINVLNKDIKALSYNGLYIQCNATSCDMGNVKLEIGNKATEWSPAPEDIQSEISTIESETKSIKAAVTSLQLGTDSISASVKSLQETMTSTTNGLANDISKVQEQVNLAMTSADVKLEIQKEMGKGTNKVTTSTGFTFDQNGLNISKTDSEMKTQITEDGMKIYKNSEVMLTANNQGVDAKNLHATTYLIIGNNSRMEDFTENGSKRTAVFWIG